MKKFVLIALSDAAFNAHDVIGVAKGESPATVHTLEVPLLNVMFRNGNPLYLTYTTEEERDNEYTVVVDALTEISKETVGIEQ